MLTTYRTILSLPGAWQFSVAGLITRFPMAILGLGIVLFIQGVTGSYTQAGILSAVYMVAQASANPFLAKMVDRNGQSRVMVPVTLIHIAATIALIIATYASAWVVVYPITALTGATVGSVGSMVRARWAHVAPTPKDFSTALSWESVADEFLFVTGPVLVTMLATVVSPPLGIIASSVTLAVGALFYYSRKDTEPPPGKSAPDTPRGRLMSNPAILVVVLSQIFLGINFGAVEVSTVALAEEHSVKQIAGLALAVFAVGSLSAGIVYGAMAWKNSARTRYAIFLVLLAVGGFAYQLASTFAVLCVVSFIVGLAVAPSLIAASSIIEHLAPAHRLTEAFSWISTMMALGVAGGSALAGAVTDGFGAHTAFLVPAAGSSLAALLIISCYRLLDTHVHAGGTPSREVVDTGSLDTGTIGSGV